MRALFWLGPLTFGYAACAAAQGTCVPTALPDLAKAVMAVRRDLRGQSVAVADPAVPPRVAAQLMLFKDKLTASAIATFSCAGASATSEAMQTTLAEALQANEASASESVVETRDKRDVGAYGSDLAVQVFQLFGHPKFFEVDFRWGIECGDDHLLLVFEADEDHAGARWHERLRWSAPGYTNVGDAFGDFVTLTPLTGSYKTPTWRFLVAHGHPGCADSPRRSRFDLDLLSPTADPAKPRVDWHFEHAYLQGHAAPSLATTEDTVDFRIVQQPVAGKAEHPLPAPEIYRFHLTQDGRLEPSPATGNGDSAGTSGSTQAKPATTSSPQ